MSVQNVSTANSNNFKGNHSDNKGINTALFTNNIKDGKKKLTLALVGLAAVSVTTLALYKTGKLNGIIDSLQQLKNKNKLGNSNEDLIRHSTKFVEFDTNKPKLDTAIRNNSLIKNQAVQDEALARIEAQAKADEIAQQAQKKFNKPFEDKLAHKSAKESAAVFMEEHNVQIQSEALSRLEQERNIKQAQEVQDKLIETLQNPSGMSKAEKQALSDSLENRLVAQDIKPTSKTKKILEYTEFSRFNEEQHRMFEIEGTGKLTEPESVTRLHYCPDVEGRPDVHYYATFNPYVDPEKHYPFYNISYVNGDTKYIFDFNTAGNKKIKIRQADGSFKTIARETQDKVVTHLNDGTTQVLDKLRGYVTVYDKKGNIIDSFSRTYTETPKVATCLTNSGRAVERIIPGQTILNSDIDRVEFPFDYDPIQMANQFMDNIADVLKRGKISLCN